MGSIVNKLVLRTGQAIYEVQGNEGIYHVQRGGLKDSCNCKAFIDGVIIQALQPICSHLLAVKIGDKLDLIEDREITLDTLLTIFGS